MPRMRSCATMLVAFGLLSTSVSTMAQEPPTDVGTAVAVSDPTNSSAGFITIRKVEDPYTADAQGSPPPANWRYILLTVRFEAASDKPFQAGPWFILLQDTDGHLYEYADVPRPADALPPALRSQDLSAGDRVTGAVGFAVPTGAVIARVLYRSDSEQQLIPLLNEVPTSVPAVAFGTAVPFADPAGDQAGFITVRGMEDPFTAYLPANPPAADQRYVLLEASFEAAEDKPFGADPGGVLLHDSNGFLWEHAEVVRPPEAPTDVQGQELSPGDRVSGPIGYVVPKSAVIDQIIYRSEAGTRLTTLVGPLHLASSQPSSAP